MTTGRDRKPHIPKLCHHRPSGRGYVTNPATGKEVYLGEYGTKGCLDKYNRWVVWLQDRRTDVASGTPPGEEVTVFQLTADFMVHAEKWYVKYGKQTSEVLLFRQVLAVAGDLHGQTLAKDFGPAAFKSVRAQLVQYGLARKHINEQMARIRRAWKWGVEHELVPESTLRTLQAVAPLTKGRTTAPEEEAVEPVEMSLVWATVAVAPSQLAAMIQIQYHAAMRAEDVVIMRPCDIDQTTWIYVPWTHKTEHKGKQRRLFLGPKARQVLLPLLEASSSAESWLFPGRGRGPHATYRGPITVSGYRQAIARVCRKEKLAHWFPLQLRHTALTAIRSRYGLEGSQVAAGHAHADVTQIYTARDEELARRIAEEMG